MPTFVDLSGQTFGRLTVLDLVGPNANRKTLWRARCVCGALVVVRSDGLRGGSTRSCGCLQREAAARTGKRNRRHGRINTPEYKSWYSMLRRCLCVTNPNYPYYGGRGISFDPRWRDFVAFFSDLGPRSEGLTLDRIDPDADYSASNCRWAPWSEQRRNQRRCRAASA